MVNQQRKGVHLGIYTRNQVRLYSKNPYVRAFNSEGQEVVGSYLMINNSNIRLFGS